MKKTISHVGLALLIFTLLAGGASATTVSVGGGTFTYYFSTTTEACGSLEARGGRRTRTHFTVLLGR
jgi:hypothetical protein